MTSDPAEPRNNFHVTIAREYDPHYLGIDHIRQSVGLILCDNKGAPDPLQISKTKNPRESLKTTSGATEHSSYQPPYGTDSQSDWGRGRGYKTMTGGADDQYLDGYQADTTNLGIIIPVGRWQYATGIRKEISSMNCNWQGIFGEYDEGSGFGDSLQYQWTRFKGYALQIIPTIDMNLTDIEFITKRFLPTDFEDFPFVGRGTLHCGIANDTADVPDEIEDISVEFELTFSPVDDNDLVQHVLGTLPAVYEIVTDQAFWIVWWVTNAAGDNLVEDDEITYGILQGFIGYANNRYATVDNLEDDWTISFHLYRYEPRPYFRLTSSDDATPIKAHFAEHKRCMFVGIEYLDGSNSKLFMNGELGYGYFDDTAIPGGNARNKGYFRFYSLFGEDEYSLLNDENAILRINRGRGAMGITNWATINEVYEVNPGEMRLGLYEHNFYVPFPAPDVKYSEAVIYNTNRFKEIILEEGDPPEPIDLPPIKDMRSINGAILISFGVLKHVLRLRYLIDLSVPSMTIEITDEGYWADAMRSIVRAGLKLVYRIRRGISRIAHSGGIDWNDPRNTETLQFQPDDVDETGGDEGSEQGDEGEHPANSGWVDDENIIGDQSYYITGDAVYGDDPHLWIFKENLPYEIVGDDQYEFRLSEMSNMADSRNGRAASQHSSFLYFSFHNGMQRWHFNGDLLAMGIDVHGDFGMKENRVGVGADYVGYGKYLIMAYDAGTDGYSSIQVWNGMGWHEFFRAPRRGDRILSVTVQSIDGSPHDWLFFSCGADIIRMPISVRPLSHVESIVHYYPFTNYCRIDSGWNYLRLVDIKKYASKFKADILLNTDSHGGENEVLTDHCVVIGWRFNENEAFRYEYFEDEYGNLCEKPLGWQLSYTYPDPMPYPFENVLTEYVPRNETTVDFEFYKIQYRAIILNHWQRNPYSINTISLDHVSRLPRKDAWVIQFILEDNGIDLLGEPDPIQSIDDKYSLLEEYANDTLPATITIDAKFAVSKKMFIEPGSIRRIAKIDNLDREAWIYQMSIMDA